MTESSRHLLHVFPTFAVGGAQLRFVQLVRLHGDRYRHSVVALDGDLTMASRVPRGATVDYVPGAFKTRSSFGGAMQAWRTLNRLRPDVFISYNWGSMDWSLANRVLPQASHIHIEDGFGPDEAQRQLRRRVLWRRAVLNDGQTKVCVPSKRLETIAVETWRLPRNRVFYIPNGIDCTRFAPRPMATSSNEVIIGTVATLRPEKNITRLLELFCRAQARDPSRRMKLLVVGDGSERRALQKFASRTLYADRIEFAGATSTPEAFLARMDIFALSSDTEQMPLSVLEAMAIGLPVVAFNVGDLPFMVAPENVPMVSISLTESALYTETLLRLARDPGLRAHIGRANREAAAARFDERIMARAYERIFG